MTIFDLIVLLVTIMIVIMLLFFGVVWKLLDDIKEWQKSIWQEQRGIRVNVADTAEYTHNHIAPDIKELRDIEKTNQELLMPVIKWQRRLVGADSSTCETTNKEE